MFMATDLPPAAPAYVLVQAGVSTEATLTARAKADGWSDSQAGWIGKLGVAAMPDPSATSQAALDAAYAAGRQALSVAYFDNALSKGKTRLVAFLTVIDLEKQVTVRAHLPAPDYPDNALQTAYTAVDAAFRQGLSSKDQVAAGFEALRLLAAKAK